MATTKTLRPTNVTISIPEFTDQPDQRVNSNCIDKEADAINTLSEQIGTLSNLNTTEKSNLVGAINETNRVRKKDVWIATTGTAIDLSYGNGGFIIFKAPASATYATMGALYYAKQNSYVVYTWIGSAMSDVTITTGASTMTITHSKSNGLEAIVLLY